MNWNIFQKIPAQDRRSINNFGKTFFRNDVNKMSIEY